MLDTDHPAMLAGSPVMTRTTLMTLAFVAVAQPIMGHAQDSTLEEVVVTAQKREERLIEVPMSIAALSGEQLEKRGFSSIQDISFAVPGMAMREDGPGSYTIFMRGLSNQYGNGALVGVYLDEAPLSLTGLDQLDTRVLDLERVEVLKGPQGTLYGQGAVAGAIRYITKKPVLDQLQARVEASEAFVDSGDSKETFTGVVNVPVVENVFGLRVAATVENGGGWQDQPQAGIRNGNNQDLMNVRARALWQATDAFTVTAMAVIHRNESKLGLGFESVDRTVPVAVDPARVLIPKKFEYDLYNVDLAYDFGSLELLSASTYIDHNHEYPFSYFGGPETVYEGALEGTDARYVYANQFSEELRLSSKGEGALVWTVGGFYRTLNRNFYALYDTLFAGFLFPDTEYFSKDTYESYSLFGDASYAITPRLKLGVGVRYFEDDQTTQTLKDGSDLEKDSFDSVDPRVYASFKVTEDMNVYASVAKGFRSGGFNRGELANYDPESLISYELGVKGVIADQALSYEAAVYFSDYSDMLRRGLVFNPDTGETDQITSNIGQVHVKGVEGGLTWRATDKLTLNATASYIDSEIVEVSATDATNLAGDNVDYVPKLSYTTGANYAFSWSDAMPGYVRFDYSYRDAVDYTDRTSFLPQFIPQTSDDIGLLDARLGLAWRAASFELYGSNLTNENKFIDPYIGWQNANRTRPRTVGLKVTYDLGR
jgi:outer membrane receptor protein involved in Fe transport